MIYPAQTSLMAVQIALARFVETGGPSASSGLYPYWYLGTTPFRYLTGPVLPLILVGLHRILPSLTLFEVFFLVIGGCWVVGGIGVYSLVVSLANSFTSERCSPPSEECIRPPRRRFALMAAVFYLFGPILPLLFRFSNGLYLIAFSFLPFALVVYLRLLRKWSLKLAILLVSLLTFVILLDSLIIPTLVLGMAAVFLAQVGWKRAEEKLKQTFLIFAFSILLSTLWYTPGYWLTLLGAPSLAGKGLFSVIGELTKLLPTALALVIAVVSVKFFKEKNKLRDFCFYWLFTYVFLTLLRFLSDPDFWMDWISYGTELQLGLAVFGGMVVGRWASNANSMRMKIVRINANVLIIFIIWLFLFNKYVIETLQSDITQTVEYRIGKELDEKVRKGEKVFLSGSTAFWLNAFFDVAQVRGGVDQAAVDKDWREAVWEIRDGSTGASTELSRTSSPQEGERSVEWLRKLGVTYLVVHTGASEEFYQDFRNPEKFESMVGLRKVYDKSGDRIYKIN
jgi:hypothetical protein